MKPFISAAPSMVLSVAISASSAARADVPPDDADFRRAASWASQTAQSVEDALFAWLERTQSTDEVRRRARLAWDQAIGNDDLLFALISAAAEAHPLARDLYERTTQSITSASLPNPQWREDSSLDPFLRDNLRLFVGRFLVHTAQHEEALSYLRELDPGDVVDPAGLLFYRAVAGHQLLKRDEAIESLSALLEREDELPRRYATLAPRMLKDLESLEDDSLDHISRRMGDIRRRLDFGHAGPKVRLLEDGVIASLDKLIEEIEQQQQNAQQAAASGQSGGSRSSSPAEDSFPLGGKGPGRVAKKDLGDGRGWGSLDPKEREDVLQQIGQDFPAHYREVIQEYFRKMAESRE